MTLVYLAVAFAAGVAAGHLLRSEGLTACAPPAWLFPSLVTCAIVSLFLVRRRRPARRRRLAPLALGIVLFLVLGAWRYAGAPFDRCWTAGDLAYYQTEAGVWATVEGRVLGFPDLQDRGVRYQLAVERVIVDGREHEVTGRALVEAGRHPVYAYGDRLRVEGLLLTPPAADDFDYRRYLATRNIHTLVRRPRIERVATGGGQRSGGRSTS